MKRKFTEQQREDLLDAIEFRLGGSVKSVAGCPLCLKYGGLKPGLCGKCPADKKWRYNKTYCDHYLSKRYDKRRLLHKLLTDMKRSVGRER